MDAIKLFDVVELTTDLPGTGLHAGCVGTVLDEYSDGELEIEFGGDEEGVTRAVSPSLLKLHTAFADMPTQADLEPHLHFKTVNFSLWEETKSREAGYMVFTATKTTAKSQIIRYKTAEVTSTIDCGMMQESRKGKVASWSDARFSLAA